MFIFTKLSLGFASVYLGWTKFKGVFLGHYLVSLACIGFHLILMRFHLVSGSQRLETAAVLIDGAGNERRRPLRDSSVPVARTFAAILPSWTEFDRVFQRVIASRNLRITRRRYLVLPSYHRSDAHFVKVEMVPYFCFPWTIAELLGMTWLRSLLFFSLVFDPFSSFTAFPWIQLGFFLRQPNDIIKQVPAVLVPNRAATGIDEMFFFLKWNQRIVPSFT